MLLKSPTRLVRMRRSRLRRLRSASSLRSSLFEPGLFSVGAPVLNEGVEAE